MSYTKLLYHIVFATKERRPFLKADLLLRVCDYISGIVRSLDGQAIAANGAADHLHFALNLPPTVMLADALRMIKDNSSK